MTDEVQIFRRATTQTERVSIKPAFVWDDDTLINDRVHEALFSRDEISRDEIDQLIENIMEELKSDSHSQMWTIGNRIAVMFGYADWKVMNAFNFRMPEKRLAKTPIKNIESFKLLSAGKKRVGHGFDKQPYTYLRGCHGGSKKVDKLFSKDVSPELQARIDAQLEFFKDRELLGQAVFARIIAEMDKALPELNTSEVLDRAAVAFGYVGWNNMKKKNLPDHLAKEALRNRKNIQGQQDRAKAYKARLLKVPTDYTKLVPLLFHRNTVYLEAIEKLLTTYQDEYLDESLRKYLLRFTKYPDFKMTMEETFESFGQFLNSVRKLDEVFENPIEADGLKKFARMLYCWHFRRFIPTDFMVRHCKHLPRKYRAAAYKNQYDNSLGEEYTDGPDYSDVDFAADDDPRYQGEEDGDNVGNR
jgi:hypothetical protein